MASGHGTGSRSDPAVRRRAPPSCATAVPGLAAPVDVAGHLSTVEGRAGQRVTAGQVVALAGTTGNSTGPHLHFEVRDGTKPSTRLPLLR